MNLAARILVARAQAASRKAARRRRAELERELAGYAGCAGQGENDQADTRRIGKESCPIAPTPNDEGKERQGAADSKNEIFNDLIQK